MTERTHIPRQKRFDSINLVSFAHFTPEGKSDLEGVGRTLDLSEGGIFLEISSPVPPSVTNLEVTLGIRDHIVRAQGVIVHQRELGADRFGLGIAFQEITPDDRQIIGRFLASTDGE